MSNELIVENLSFKCILKDINFTLKEGTITALMGKSGSGKTILLKTIIGLINSEGFISVGGAVITQNSLEIARKNFGIYLGLNTLENKTVFSNIICPLNNLNYTESKARKKIYEVAKKLGIENLLYKEINMLSHSQKKIVAFAQSIIHEPPIILIDGLFDSLDSYYKNKVITYLKQINKTKKSIIIFTTSNSEDLMFSDNLLVIKNGKIAINGNIKELLINENLFLKNDVKLPFLIDLSFKLKIYDLIDRLVFDIDEMVDEIWQ